jgi:hypothetical protein
MKLCGQPATSNVKTIPMLDEAKQICPRRRRSDAFNPAELFLAAIAACMINSSPRMTSIDYELIVDTDETHQRLELLYTSVRKYGATPILESVSHQASDEQINTMREILPHLPRLNGPAPDFEAKTTHGMRRLADYMGCVGSQTTKNDQCFHGGN